MSSIAQASNPTLSTALNWRNRLLTLLPLGLTAWLALQLSEHPAIAKTGLSALTLAMFAGMFAGNTLPRGWLTPPA